MAVRLLASIERDGEPIPAGRVVRLDAATERGLIAAGLAVVAERPADWPDPAGTPDASLSRVEAGRVRSPGGAPATIALSRDLNAVWWPLNEGAGTTVQDRVHGLQAEVIGTTANAWSNADVLTLAADTAVRLQNAAQVFDIMRLDTLTGSLIVGIEVGGGIPASSPVAYAWGYGDASVSSGAIGGIVNASQLALFGYRAVSGSLTTLSGLMGNIKTLGRHMFHWVIHRNLFEGRLYIEGYIDGWQSRGSRVAALEGAESPVGDNSRGLRIGARPTGPSGTTNYLGANGAAPQIANFHAIRLEGDYRHRIPGWIDNICATIPYGAVPEVLNHG